MTCQVYWGMGDKGSVLRERHGNPAVVLKIRCSTTNSTVVDTHTKVCLPLLLLQTTVRRRHPEGGGMRERQVICTFREQASRSTERACAAEQYSTTSYVPINAASFPRPLPIQLSTLSLLIRLSMERMLKSVNLTWNKQRPSCTCVPTG